MSYVQYGTTNNNTAQPTQSNLGLIEPVDILWDFVNGRANLVFAVNTIIHCLNEYYSKNSKKDIWFNFENVKTILRVYANVIEKNPDLPEYSDEYGLRTDAERYAVQWKVANDSGISRVRVEETLNCLYWASINGEVDTWAFIRPRTYAAGKTNRETTPESHKDMEDCGIECILTRIITIGGIAIGGLLVFKIINEVS